MLAFKVAVSEKAKYCNPDDEINRNLPIQFLAILSVAKSDGDPDLAPAESLLAHAPNYHAPGT